MNKSLSCNLCEYKTNLSANLKRHKAQIHDIDVKWFYCDIDDCEFKCKSNSELKTHKAYSHNINVKWYFCDVKDCEFKFKDNSHLKRHKLYTHNIDVTWYYCNIDQCEYKSKTNGDLKTHKTYVHNIDVVWYCCNIGDCNFKSKGKGNLKKHKAICTGTDTNLSYGEYRIKEMLDEMMVDYTHDKTHYHLTQFCGQALRPDFLIEKDGYRPILIEYHGIHHVKPSIFGSQTEEQAYLNFLKQQEHDQIKRDFCKENNYNLVEIYYTENANIDLLVIGCLVKYHNWCETDYF
jgi:uncharacterized Zn-finger protein